MESQTLMAGKIRYFGDAGSLDLWRVTPHTIGLLVSGGVGVPHHGFTRFWWFAT
jgi:hypothetical protein